MLETLILCRRVVWKFSEILITFVGKNNCTEMAERYLFTERDPMKKSYRPGPQITMIFYWIGPAQDFIHP